MSGDGLTGLNRAEQKAVSEFVRLLDERFGHLISAVALFGSKARGESMPDSDVDLLVVVDSDDWRVHKQVRYLAADLSLKKPIHRMR